jgi:hypothetical protein
MRIFSYNKNKDLTNQDYDYIFYNIGQMRKYEMFEDFLSGLASELFFQFERRTYHRIIRKFYSMRSKDDLNIELLKDREMANIFKSYIDYCMYF